MNVAMHIPDIGYCKSLGLFKPQIISGTDLEHRARNA